jgi:hypothetical protein
VSHPRGPFREEHVMHPGDQNTLGTQYDQHTLGDQDQGSSLASDETQTRVRTRIEKPERLQREEAYPRAHHGWPLSVGSPLQMACSLSCLTVRFNRLGRT